MDDPNICMSRDADVPAITAIYAHHIDTGTASVRMAGALRHIGYKHGRRLETVFMQLALGEGTKAPPG